MLTELRLRIIKFFSTSKSVLPLGFSLLFIINTADMWNSSKNQIITNDDDDDSTWYAPVYSIGLSLQRPQ